MALDTGQKTKTHKMKTKFKDIAQYYLGTGLEVTYNLQDVGENYHDELRTHTFNYDNSTLTFISNAKPLLRSLDSLTKPITVKGYNDDKEFVPMDELMKIRPFSPSNEEMAEHISKQGIEEIPFWLAKILMSWHFNIFNLEETEYIKID